MNKNNSSSFWETMKDSSGFVAMILIFLSMFIWVVVGVLEGSYEGHGLIVMILVPFVLLLMALLTVKDIAQLMDDGQIDSKACQKRHALYAIFVVCGVAASLYMKFNLLGGSILTACAVIGKFAVKKTQSKAA
ncbi:hypothetical protein [Vibrio alginolyticus]|uniref:hypothetical protein n=1 Tax=Vibrio alginolyticus TaxID=663 RepID=UPI00215EE253|nr:hypothetical protein [Vibrio alginolyticus]MCS0212248.1 hypothetical protein [Vibrio alginolyticus]